MSKRVKECVVSIHGINSDGAWQILLKPLLSPHFDYVYHTYRQYGWDGPLRIFLGRWWPIYGAVIVVAAYLVFAGYLWWPVALALVPCVAVACHFHAGALRNLVKERFAGELPISAHIIAHSFGTYIVGSALREIGNVSYRRVILFGTVLSCDFPWTAIDRSRFVDVRNELAGQDSVARLASFGRRFVPYLGQAGILGFCEQTNVVHTVFDPKTICHLCSAFVHNVVHPWLRHGTIIHTIRQQALKFWLPHLWNYAPDQFQRFLSLCLAVAGGAGKLTQGASRQHLLLNGEWDWCDGPLIPFLKKEIQYRRTLDGLPLLSWRALDDRATRALRMSATLVAGAVRAATKKQIKHQPELRYLSPQAALLRAVEALYS